MTQQIEVVGKAVYLEFRKATGSGSSATTQILLTPEARANSTISPGASTFTEPFNVQMAVYRRRISNYQPRKTWRFIAAGKSSTAVPTGAVSPAVSVNSAALTLLEFTNRTFEAMASDSWVLFKEPVVVEVTSEDMMSIRLGKTPYKVLGRVWRSRKFLGFPAEFYDKPTA
jgi:hypothetical protein